MIFLAPWDAFDYAFKHGPSEETREVACIDPFNAYSYAYYVDKCPREDTRKAACRNTQWTYYYARDIDKCPMEETWLAIKGTQYEEEYRKIFKELVEEEII